MAGLLRGAFGAALKRGCVVQADMDRCAHFAFALGALLGWGCGSATPPPPETPQPAPPQTAPRAPEGSIDGLWVEFWALQGHADTQRYALFPDGRFGWCAAKEGPTGGARRWGTWSTEGDMLVLRVRGQDSGTGCATADCRAQHEPPLEERLQLGPCPPNEEARRLDASYRCLSIAGQAFWRREQAEDPAAYVPE